MSVITKRDVADAYFKYSGDYVNFQHSNGFDHHTNTVMIRKVEYPNMNFNMRRGINDAISVAIVGTNGFSNTFAITIPTEDCGVGYNTSSLSFGDLLSWINRAFAQQLKYLVDSATLNTPSTIALFMNGEFLELKLSFPWVNTTVATPTWTIQFNKVYGGNVDSSELYYQFGFSNVASGANSYQWVNSYATHSFKSVRAQTYAFHHMILCSKVLGRALGQTSPVDSNFIMRLPVDPFGDPGSKEVFIPINETRAFPIHAMSEAYVDFYMKREIGGDVFQSNNLGIRLIVYLDGYSGDPKDLSRVFI